MNVGPDGRGGPHVFVDDLEAPELDDGDVHHLVRVLRTSVGDGLTLSDGEGRWVPAVVVDGDGRVEPAGDLVEVDPPPYALAVAFTPVKGDRPEWAVQKLTEIGIDRIVPVAAERSVVRWDRERSVKQVDKLRRVAREAAMQSRRVRLPVIEEVMSAAALMGEPSAAVAEPGSGAPSGEERVLVIGPEGGWSSAELEQATNTVGLGPNVLRAETATVVGAALLVAFRSGVCRPTTNSG